jgi:RND family efflux transporter MFP subunit
VIDNSIGTRVRSVVAGMAVAALAACGGADETASRTAAAAPADVALVDVAGIDWPSLYEAGGVVRARNTAALSSRIVAPIVEVAARAGDRVTEGQVLVRLDGRELEANSTRARAAAAAAVLTQQAVQGELSAADAALTLARATHERVRGLRARDSATEQEMDEAAAALSGAEARVAAARARVAEAEQTVAATLAADVAASAVASYAVLTAPFSGTVSARHADPGTLATPGSPVLTIDDASGYRLEARIDESERALVREGDEVEYRLDRPAGATASQAWQRARVSEIAQIDPARHSFLVRVDLAGGEGLSAGQFGRVRLFGPARRALAVPRTAVVRRGQLAFAYAVDGGVARLRMVSVGEESSTHVEILAGLAEGDRVVASPAATLGDGAEVRSGSREQGGGR